MNTLRSLRADLKTALGDAGLRVTDHLPERISPPLVMLAAGSPYLEAGDTYGSFNVRFTVVLVASQGPNEVATAALDEHVTAALVALDNRGIAVERVDQPTMLEHGTGYFLSTTIDVLHSGVHIDDGRDG